MRPVHGVARLEADDGLPVVTLKESSRLGGRQVVFGELLRHRPLQDVERAAVVDAASFKQLFHAWMGLVRRPKDQLCLPKLIRSIAALHLQNRIVCPVLAAQQDSFSRLDAASPIVVDRQTVDVRERPLVDRDDFLWQALRCHVFSSTRLICADRILFCRGRPIFRTADPGQAARPACTRCSRCSDSGGRAKDCRECRWRGCTPIRAH